jgi:hypothetical protein
VSRLRAEPCEASGSARAWESGLRIDTDPLFQDAVASADTMGEVLPEAWPGEYRFAGLCISLSPCGHSRCCLCLIRGFTHPPSYPPSLGTVLLAVLFRGSSPRAVL